MQLALKRAGTQPFSIVANMLRTLDRPEAFLQQAVAAPPVRRTYPVALESALSTAWAPIPESRSAAHSAAGDSAHTNTVRAMVQEAVQEIVPRQPEPAQADDEEEYESNEDYDSEG